jgi:radical SAM superfamily enzyme YgiQ (UPF0313 family)
MRVLVLNLPGPFCRAGSRWPHGRKEKGLGYNPFPFYLSYATSVLLKNGVEADIKDCIALEWDEKKLLNYFKKFQPEVIVVETSTPSYNYDIKFINKLDCIKVAVGAHATATISQHISDGFDYVIVGEYDFSLLNLVKHLSGKVKTLPKNIATKKTPRAQYIKLIEDLDSIPWPCWELMPMEKYSDPFCLGKNIAVLSSRGCPMNCSFCNISVFFGKPNYRTRDPVKVCDEIEFLISKHKPDEIYFDDDTITISKNHILSLCKEIKKRQFGIPWSCMGDAKVDADVLEAMAESGCRAMKFGVESADPKVLEKIPKHINLDDVKRTVKKCKEVGIKTHATYMFGLPGENKEKAIKTIKFALELGTDTLQFSIATPYPGTEFYKAAEENNWFTTKNWDMFNAAGTSVIGYSDYSEKEIIEIFKKAWTAWDRHMLVKKPGTILHHMYGVQRRNGFISVAKTIGWGCKRIIKGR